MAGAARRSWHKEIILYLGHRFDVPYRNPIRVGAWSIPDVAGTARDLLEDTLDDARAFNDAELLMAGMLDKPTAFVIWDAEAFLGRTPTKAESAAISRALKALTRGPGALVQRRPPQGEKRQRRIRLTARGKARYRALLVARPGSHPT